ncbi:hypothetical protein B0J11DRAFT_573662 [Dendryphion nanum]|uniref:Uncharacterized protein n=1 Tax=Dendryphion nanum TaxID=256645 RepID=A0A9P9I6H6_9PLEO|nr:hypothetical protein B0J11DRAFT_573662 [Dendryphion nanum]
MAHFARVSRDWLYAMAAAEEQLQASSLAVGPSPGLPTPQKTPRSLKKRKGKWKLVTLDELETYGREGAPEPDTAWGLPDTDFNVTTAPSSLPRSPLPASSALDDLKQLVPPSGPANKNAYRKRRNRHRPKKNDMSPNTDEKLAAPQPGPENANAQTVSIPPHLRKRLTNVDGAPTQPQQPAQPQQRPPPAVSKPQLPPSPPRSALAKNRAGGWNNHASPWRKQGNSDSIPRGNHDRKYTETKAPWKVQVEQPKQKRKPTKWIKQSEIPRGPKPGEDYEWLDYDIKSNSGGDPNYDIRKLVDWDGNWMPAPIDWDDRKAYRDRHFADHIEIWIDKQPGCTTEPLCISADGLGSKTVTDDIIAPKYWVWNAIERQSPQDFWRTFPARAPAPMSDVDITESAPWWETFKDERLGRLPVIQVPDASVDPGNPENHNPDLANTVNGEIGKRKKGAQLRKEKEERRMARLRIALLEAEKEVIPPPRNALKPKVNIYLRPVDIKDIRQINEIYNVYVERTVHAIEFKPRTLQQMAQRVSKVVDGNLPFIVAVLRGPAQTDQRQSRQQFHTEEKIVGFAKIEDFCHSGSVFRHAMQMEMYAHVRHINMGIGSCLLDRMLILCDPFYVGKQGYDWVCRSEYMSIGPSRRIKNIIVNFPYARNTEKEKEKAKEKGKNESRDKTKDKNDSEGKADDHNDPKSKDKGKGRAKDVTTPDPATGSASRYDPQQPASKSDDHFVSSFTKLLEKFKFRRAGHLKDIGHKLGETVSVSIFQYTTGEQINAAILPNDVM